MAMSNVGRWAPWYSSLPPNSSPIAYGDSEAYRLGADWLKDCAVVQDWGCGLGWARQFYRADQYVGIDGTESPFADVVADLASPLDLGVAGWGREGIFMRGVIEHDYNWEKILAHAYRTFTERMCLVLFTPMVLRGPEQIAFVQKIGVPDLSFSLRNIIEPMREHESIDWKIVEISSPNTGYGVETLFFMEKP